MAVNLLPDQAETLARLRAEMGRHKSVLLQAPTGWGKTAASVYMLSQARAKGKRVIFTVPRKDLLEQTSKDFDGYNLDHSYIAAGRQFNPYSRAYIGMVDTMARRLDSLPDEDLVIVDETHYGSTALDRIIQHYKAKGAWIVGLSASPWKLSGEGLGKWYSSMVRAPDIRWLIDNKRLCEYRAFAPSRPDLSGITVSAGDYQRGQLSSFMEQDRVIVGDAVRHYRERAMGRLNLAFCTSIKHAEIVADTFKASGIPAASIDGKMDMAQRRKIIRAFAMREILVMTNCDLCTFGFDLSMASGMKVTVEVMSDLRPTKSLALQCQKWGRVLRYKDYPAIIFDHAGNMAEHGMPCAEREWSLESRVQKKSDGEKAPPTRQCPNCFYVHSPAPICPECGTAYEVKSREIDEVDGELIEIDKDSEVRKRRTEQGRARTLDDLIALGQKRGMKYPAQWAAKVLAGRMMKNANST